MAHRKYTNPNVPFYKPGVRASDVPSVWKLPGQLWRGENPINIAKKNAAKRESDAREKRRKK